MNKKLLAVSIAATFAAPMAASADATIYGNIMMGAASVKTEVAGVTQSDSDFTRNGDGQLGIQGSEDLGNGLTALYKIEFDFNAIGTQATQAGNATLTSDEIWIGLTGDFGTFLIGEEDTPYKTFMNSAGYDFIDSTFADSDSFIGVGGGVGMDRFTGVGAVAYVSPNFNGFTVAAAIIPGGQSGVGGAAAATGFTTLTTFTTATTGATTGTIIVGTAVGAGGANNNDGIADHYSIAAMYSGGGLTAAIGYEEKVSLVEAVGVAENDQETFGVSASYTIGDLKVAAVYEDQENVAAATTNGTNEAENIIVSGIYSLGNTRVGLLYGQSEVENSAGVEVGDTQAWSLYADHALSNRTKIYAVYGDAEDDTTDTETKGFEVGLSHSF